MLIFLYGENVFLAQERLAEMRRRFKEKYDQSGLNLLEFPRSGTEKLIPGDVLQAVQSAPFLAERRMITVKGALDSIKKADVPLWSEGVSRVHEDTILIFFESKKENVVERHPFYKTMAVEAHTHSYRFPAFSVSQAFVWLHERAKRLRVKMADPLIHELIATAGTDAWALAQELEKLRALAGGLPVTKEMVRLLVRPQFNDHMFDFVDAVVDKNTPQAVNLLHEQRSFGSAEGHLYVMLARQLRLLITVKSYIDQHPDADSRELNSALGIHPFVARKVLQQAKKFTLQELLSFHEGVVIDDKGIKTGKLNDKTATDRALLHLLLGSDIDFVQK